MKKFVLSLLGAFAIVSCSTDEKVEMNDSGLENLKTSIAEFENQLSEKSFSATKKGSDSLTKADLVNTKNDYDYHGQNFLYTYESIGNYMDTLKIEEGDTYEKLGEPFVNSQIAKFEKVEDFNEEEKLLKESFDKNLTISVDYVKSYENFVADNYSDQSKVKNFLLHLTEVKTVIYITNSDVARGGGRSFAAWENCVVACVRRKLNEEDDAWTVAIFGQITRGVGLVGMTFTYTATCGYRCREKGVYS